MFPEVIKNWLCLTGVLGIGLVGCASESSLSLNVLRSDGLEFDCAVGDVTSREAVVWLKTEGPQQVSVQFTTDPLWRSYQETPVETTSQDRDFTIHAELSHLQPATRYLYRGAVSGKTTGRHCRFKTAPLSDNLAPATFVIGGDTRHSFRPFSIMHAMREDQPDFFVFLGDTIYADKEGSAHDLKEYWAKYVENRDGFVERLLAETSVYVMWDDHEVDSDFIATHSLMPVGRQAFFDYWPLRPQKEDSTRLFRSVRWGKGMELFLLDTRQYRDPAKHTMLGAEQKQWLLDRLASCEATFKFILSSVPFSDPRKDKWGEYPEERDEILDFIQNHGISDVIFLAGDVHHGGVARMPDREGIKELIFGPLGAPMNYKISPGEPRFDFFYENTPNYGKVMVDPDPANPSVRVEWLDEKHRLIHRVIIANGQYDQSSPH